MVDTKGYGAEEGAEAIESRPSTPESAEMRHEPTSANMFDVMNAKLDLLLSAQGIDYKEGDE